MNKFIFRLYQISLLLLIFWGAHAWFTWSWDFLSNEEIFVLNVLFAGVALVYKYNNRISLKTDVKTILFAFLFIAASFACVPFITMILRSFVIVIPLWVLLSDKMAQEHLRFIAIALSILIMPGFILHLAFLGGLTMPGLPMVYGEDNQSYTMFFNYFFVIESDYWKEQSGLIRFNSVFLEPSYLGTLLAFLLYAGKYNLKKWYYSFLLVYLIASFSLAGIITTIIGYLLSGDTNSVESIANKKHKRNVIVTCVILLFVYLFAINYNNGNNVVNELVIQRLQLSNDDKIIQGNNRFELSTDIDYDRLIREGRIFWGLRNEVLEFKSSAGYKRFILQYGLIPALIYLLMYSVLGSYSRNKRYGRVLALLVVLVFIQAAYPSSFSWIIPAILGVRNDSLDYENFIYSKLKRIG